VYCAEWADNDGKASNIMIPNASIIYRRVPAAAFERRYGAENRSTCVVAVDEKGQNMYTPLRKLLRPFRIMPGHIAAGAR
jgi:hypothetical protein